MALLEGKTAIVTGSGGGIGRAIALELARAAVNVVVAEINIEKADEVVAEIKSLGGEAIAVSLDITDSHSISHCIEQTLTQFGQIDILINNAGVMPLNDGPEASIREFDICYRVNLKGVWQMTIQVAKQFKKQQSGKVVNIASPAGLLASPSCPAYAASKAGVINLTPSLALLLAADNINVNGINPGFVKTAITEQYAKKINNPNVFDDFSENSVPLRRRVMPEDIADSVMFLVSPQSKNITGHTLDVTGGALMGGILTANQLGASGH